jgi:hypothetical protein
MAILFNYNGYLINESILKVENNSHKINSILQIFHPEKQYPSKEHYNLKGLILNIFFFFLGLFGLFTFSTVWVILGFIICTISGYNIYSDYTSIRQKPFYSIIILLKNDQLPLSLNFNDKIKAEEFYALINGQMKK